MIDRQKGLTLLMAGTLCLLNMGLAVADDHEQEAEHHGRHWRGTMREFRSPVRQVMSPTYAKECGACHMAYQPGLMPPRAWAQIMTPDALSNHYGDDASLPEELRKEIGSVLGIDSPNLALQGNPLDQTGGPDKGALPRISTTESFRDAHDRIPARLVKDTPEIGSFSQCNACHRRAADGDYNERGIVIPGYGTWRD